MSNSIHPAIEKLNISKNAKICFNALEFHKIVEDRVYIEERELRQNSWSFKIPQEILEYITKEDIKNLYVGIIKSRSEYLQINYPKVNMIFDAWYSYMAGSFYFSLFPVTYPKLDFQIEVDSLDEIIQNFIDDPYKGVIPMNELQDIDPEDSESGDDYGEFTRSVKIWSIIIPNFKI